MHDALLNAPTYDSFYLSRSFQRTRTHEAQVCALNFTRTTQPVLILPSNNSRTKPTVSSHLFTFLQVHLTPNSGTAPLLFPPGRTMNHGRLNVRPFFHWTSDESMTLPVPFFNFETSCHPSPSLIDISHP